MEIKKVLVIRFSSIGDIVLTSPIVRSLKKASPKTEIHYLTKRAHAELLLHNPYIDKVHSWQTPLKPLFETLKQEKFDYILDLHHNLRSLRVKWKLKTKASSFPKENLAKYLLVRFKVQSHPIAHIVERYGKTLEGLGLGLDSEGLDFFIPELADRQAAVLFSTASFQQSSVLCVVLGAKYKTKRWIPDYFIQLLNAYGNPVILIGGPDAREEADEIMAGLKIPVLDVVAKVNLMVSAALMNRCDKVLAHDTGFMHIAAALQKNIFSIWGNTVPAFGMTPYKAPHIIVENKDLPCRPCSKIGFDQCPKGHFKCMKELTPDKILPILNEEENPRFRT